MRCRPPAIGVTTSEKRNPLINLSGQHVRLQEAPERWTGRRRSGRGRRAAASQVVGPRVGQASNWGEQPIRRVEISAVAMDALP